MNKNITKIKQAGFTYKTDGQKDGFSTRLFEKELRNFSELLIDWQAGISAKSSAEFLKKVCLDGAVSAADLELVIKGKKAFDRNIINFLAAQVPFELCGNISFRNRGLYELSKANKEDVVRCSTLTDLISKKSLAYS